MYIFTVEYRSRILLAGGADGKGPASDRMGEEYV